MAYDLNFITSGQAGILTLPTNRRICKMLVVCRGGGLNWAYATDPASSSQQMTDALRYVADQGMAVLSSMHYDLSLTGLEGDAYGNNNSTTALKTAIDYVRGIGAVDQGKIAIICHSAGNFTALNFYRRNPTMVAGILGICPAPSLDWFRGTDAAKGNGFATSTGITNGAWSQINNAFGISTDAGFAGVQSTYGTAAIVPTLPASNTGFRYGLMSNSGDLSCPPAQVDTLQALCPSGVADRRSIGSGVHGTQNVTGRLIQDFLAGLIW